MVVSGQLIDPAALVPENNAGTHRITGSEGTIAGLDVFGEEISSPYRNSSPGSSSPQRSCYTDYASAA
jgi:hypothetical protein